MAAGAASSAGTPGYFGKIACRGDFVSRGLSDAFVSTWDHWLAPRMHELPGLLEEAWLDVYLTSPILRFALPRHLLGWPVVGILMPSVDRVGRYYPLTLAVELPPDSPTLPLALAAGAWFERLEATALETLADHPLSVEELSERLGGLPLPSAAAPFEGEGAEQLMGALTAEAVPQRNQRALWWVGGSWRFTFTRSLPNAKTLAWLMGGRSRQEPGEAGQNARAAGRTDTGHGRVENQDAILVDAARDLYVVADGMGGHLDGARASRMVVDALARVPLGGTFSSRVAAVQQCVESVNRELYDFGERAGEVCGATVVVLLLAEGRFAVLWAGDSRAYRFNAAGQAEPLSQDHAHAEGGVSRACGAIPTIELECREGSTQRGDRFLLCSDGLYRHVRVAEFLKERAALPAAELADAAVAEVLRGVADDNVSVVVVDAPF